jgi:hypothetical protein
VNVLALLVLLVGAFGLDPEGVGTEVVTLSLQQVGGKVLCAVSVVEGERGAESGCGDTPESTLGDDAIKMSVISSRIDSPSSTHSLHPACAL